MLSDQEYEVLKVYLSDNYQKTKDNLKFAYKYFKNTDHEQIIEILHHKISGMTTNEYEEIAKSIEDSKV